MTASCASGASGASTLIHTVFHRPVYILGVLSVGFFLTGYYLFCPSDQCSGQKVLLENGQNMCVTHAVDP